MLGRGSTLRGDAVPVQVAFVLLEFVVVSYILKFPRWCLTIRLTLYIHPFALVDATTAPKSLIPSSYRSETVNMNVDQPSGNFVQLPWMKRPSTREREKYSKREKRLPLIGFLPNQVRNHIIAVAGEFCGTFLFLFFAFAGTQVAVPAAPATTQPDTSALLYISLVFGFSLAVNVWAFVRISGGTKSLFDVELVVTIDNI